jgi:hypothetical protein
LPGYNGAISNAFNNTIKLFSGTGTSGDPGVVFAAGASDNIIDEINFNNSTVLLRFGEIDDYGGGAACHRNWVKMVRGDNMPYGAVHFQWGDSNKVDRVEVTNVGTVDPSLGLGGIDFSPPNPVGVKNNTGNVVGFVSFGGTRRPRYGVRFGPQASNSRVDGGNVVFSEAKVLNQGTNCTANLA